MRKPVTTKTINPSELSGSERSALVDQLYAIFCRFFAEGDRDFFEHHVLFPPHRRMLLTIFLNAQKKIVGYVNVYVCDVELHGKITSVLRGAVFSDTGYKTAHHCCPLGVRIALREFLAHPFRPRVFFAIGATPASYGMFPKALPQVYPSRHGESQAAAQLVAQLAERFGLDSKKDNPFVCHFPTRPVQSDRLKRSRSLANDPDAQFFRDQIAPYGDEHVLLMLLPVSATNIVGCFVRSVKTALLRRFRGLRPAAAKGRWFPSNSRTG